MARSRVLGLLVTAALAATAFELVPLQPAGAQLINADFRHEPLARFDARTVAPGDEAHVWGSGWLPRNCDAKIHLKLRDSAGRSFSLGRFKPMSPSLYEDQGYPAGLEATPTIPDGVRPGTAKLRGTQDWAFRFPGLGCFELFQISSDRRPITILGESGNDPPRITGFAVADLAQGGPGTIRWTASEPCAATVEVEYRLAPGMSYDLPAPVAGHAGVAGANTVPYDATSGGRALPTGEYRATMQCQEANGAKSSASRDTFLVGFAR